MSIDDIIQNIRYKSIRRLKKLLQTMEHKKKVDNMTATEIIGNIMKNSAMVHEVMCILEKLSNEYRVVRIDGKTRQYVCGKMRLSKKDFFLIIQICRLYGLLKFDFRTKKAMLRC